ncbi:MAG: ASCH domain-containing protein [Pseudomonadota bacterium]
MTDRIEKALIVADPWISLILDGKKTWEMRSRHTTIRGNIGLIKKGSGLVCGVVKLVGCGEPLTPEGMIKQFDRHKIPAHLIESGQVASWNTPWILQDVRKLASPVRYSHKSGAVTWVNLDPEVSEQIHRQMMVGVR